jgi:tRNA threonylcarbamoyladenosine biosynthesis protein TsaE
MRELGARLASLLRPGDLVLCIGELGAGKTTLAQGVAAALGVSDPVTSPTFVLARVHTGRETPFVHADAYRLGGVDDPLGELDALDLDATLEDAVTLIEWGGGLAERLAPARVEVRISVSAEEVRHVVVDALGVRWAGVDMRTGFGTSRSLG